MEKIRIVTDSASDFVAPFPANLTVKSLTIRFGDEEFLDGVNIDHKTFYEKLVAGKSLPSTSLVPPADFEIAYDEAAAAGETVIAIVLSSKLSGTYQSAMLAAQGRSNVYVVDSLSATIGELVMVRYALRMVEEGKSAADIVAELERAKSRLILMGMPDTLDYLHRGGRMSKSVAILGGMLNIKPLLKVTEGVIQMFGKARGAKNGHAALVQEAKKIGGVDYSLPYCLGITGLEQTQLQRFIADSSELWNQPADQLPTAIVGATIGTHLGPGTVLMAYFNKE